MSNFFLFSFLGMAFLMFEKNCISFGARHPIAISGWPLNSESLFMIHVVKLVGLVGGEGGGGGGEEEAGEGGREREERKSYRGRSSSDNSQSLPPCQRKVSKLYQAQLSSLEVA